MTTSQLRLTQRSLLTAAALTLPLLFMACADEGAPASPSDRDSSASSGDAGASTNSSESNDKATDSDSDSSSNKPNDTSGQANSTAVGTATLKLGEDTYSFEIASCIVSAEDLLLHGPGTESSGRDAYLSVDFTMLDEWYGEVRIDLDSTSQFSSSDEFWVFSTEVSQNTLIGSAPHVSMISLLGEFKFGGESDMRDGSLEADCS